MFHPILCFFFNLILNKAFHWKVASQFLFVCKLFKLQMLNAKMHFCCFCCQTQLDSESNRWHNLPPVRLTPLFDPRLCKSCSCAFFSASLSKLYCMFPRKEDVQGFRKIVMYLWKKENEALCQDVILNSNSSWIKWKLSWQDCRWIQKSCTTFSAKTNCC